MWEAAKDLSIQIFADLESIIQRKATSSICYLSSSKADASKKQMRKVILIDIISSTNYSASQEMFCRDWADQSKWLQKQCYEFKDWY